MKIIQIIFGLSSGGAERLVVDLSNELVKEHEVILLTLKDDRIDNNDFYLPELSKNVEYINAGIKKGLSLKEAFSLYKTIKSINPDVVHYHLGNTLFYIFLSILFYRKPKYFETIHSRADKTFNNRLSFIIKYFIYRLGLVKVCAISDENRKSILSTFKLKNTLSIYNGRALPNKTNKFEEVVNEINNLKNSPDDLVFIHIGRFVEAKNQEMLISSFNYLNEIGKNFVLLIIGDGFQTEEGKKLKSKACSKIHFMGVRTNIADYLFNSDGFCLSSIFEGMPISLIESFACGCIPVCTPTSGSIDLIKNGVNGFLSNDFSEEEYIKTLLNFEKHFSKINSEDLKKLYEDNFSIDKCALNYISAYSKIN